MARKLRIQFPGAMYHVMNRGDQREPIFRDDDESLRRDWVLGSEEFRQELLAAAGQRVGLNHYGAERQETGIQKAQRIVAEELEQLGWQESDLQGHAKAHPGKVQIARRLRQQTTMSLKWIAERLLMGSWTYVSNLLSHKTETPTPQGLLPLCQ